MDTLKKAGAMLAHLDLFHSMLDLKRLLQLAAHMKDRGDRAMLVSPEEITLIGTESMSAPEITTNRGEIIDAATAYRVLQKLEGYESDEYAVNAKSLAALNARAVAELESSAALQAFGETLNKIAAAPAQATAQPSGTTQPGVTAQPNATQNATPAGAPETAPTERPSRQRRGHEVSAEAEATPATN